MHTDNNSEERFSDDPDEQLRIENELLKLKLSAELGGEFQEISDLSPEIENMFLKNVLEFEHSYAQTPAKTIFEILGRPYCKKSSELSDEEIEDALLTIEQLMEQKSIVVDYEADYPARQKYEFLIEELFPYEASMMIMPGMTMHYIYEEFHPNHEYYIRQRAQQFIENWFAKSFDEYSFELASHIIMSDESVISQEELVARFKNIFESFESFGKQEYYVDNISFDLKDEATSFGFAEGTVKYEGVLENGEVILLGGPFKFYMQLDSGMWQIFSFHWPGFGS